MNTKGHKVKAIDLNQLVRKKVKVYRNLHLHNGFFSVQNYQQGRGWRVAGHTEKIVLSDCLFKVKETRRQRVILEQRKNVHAYIEGVVMDLKDFDSSSFRYKTLQVTYNPYLFDSFVLLEDSSPIYQARYCLIQNSKVFVVLIE